MEHMTETIESAAGTESRARVSGSGARAAHQLTNSTRISRIASS